MNQSIESYQDFVTYFMLLFMVVSVIYILCRIFSPIDLSKTELGRQIIGVPTANEQPSSIVYIPKKQQFLFFCDSTTPSIDDTTDTYCQIIVNPGIRFEVIKLQEHYNIPYGSSTNAMIRILDYIPFYSIINYMEIDSSNVSTSSINNSKYPEIRNKIEDNKLNLHNINMWLWKGPDNL